MNEIAKSLIFFGIILIVFGFLIILLNKINVPLGKLPGDIVYKKGNFSFYFPLASSIILSIILTIILNLLFRR